MPESECRNCGERLVASTDEGLKKLEMDHHVASAETEVRHMLNGTEVKSTKHMCVFFRVYDEGGVNLMGGRMYAHGKYSAEDSSVR